MNTFYKRILIGFGLLSLVAAGVGLTTISHQLHQNRLDQTLIEAIKVHDTKAVLAALKAGANGEAIDTGSKPTTVWEEVLQLFHHAWYTEPQQEHLPALLLYFHGPRQPQIDFGEKAVVRALVAHGAKINDRDAQGRTALYIAAYYGRPSLPTMLDLGANIDTPDNMGRTPVMASLFHNRAMQYGRHTFALLFRGANVHAKDKNGLTVKDYVLQTAPPRSQHLLDLVNRLSGFTAKGK